MSLWPVIWKAINRASGGASWVGASVGAGVGASVGTASKGIGGENNFFVHRLKRRVIGPIVVLIGVHVHAVGKVSCRCELVFIILKKASG
jgi:L-aminopeptidase/D-esterase-like protein